MKLSTIEVNGNVKVNQSVKLGGSVNTAKNLLLNGGVTVGGGGSLPKYIFTDTTANWDAQRDLVGRKNCIYVYSDYTTIDGVNVPAIKIGDGTSYLIDMPFVIGNEATLNDHINDRSVHITNDERLFWNNKVTCFLSQSDEEIIVFSKENTNT